MVDKFDRVHTKALKSLNYMIDHLKNDIWFYEADIFNEYTPFEEEIKYYCDSYANHYIANNEAEQFFNSLIVIVESIIQYNATPYYEDFFRPVELITYYMGKISSSDADLKSEIYDRLDEFCNKYEGHDIVKNYFKKFIKGEKIYHADNYYTGYDDYNKMIRVFKEGKLTSRDIINLNEFNLYYYKAYDEDSLNLLIYDFLLKIKNEPCLKIALRLCEHYYGATYEDIKDVLLENNYLKHDFDKDSWIKYGMSLYLDEIKEIASNNGLKNYGRKKDVLIRIYENVDVNSIDADYYFLTDEGLDFIDQHEYIKYYKRVISNSFYFSRFEKYYLENGQNIDTLFRFFKMHEEIARNENDVPHLVNALAGYSQTCVYYNIKDGLYEALYEYCLRINDRKLQLFSEFLDWDNSHAIIELSKLYSDDEFEDIISEVFKNIKKTKISKKIILDSLKELLKTENYYYVEHEYLKNKISSRKTCAMRKNK